VRVNNTLAIVLVVVIITAVILDQVLNSGTATIFMLRKIFAYVEYVSFWR
jgi:phage-related holin